MDTMNLWHGKNESPPQVLGIWEGHNQKHGGVGIVNQSITYCSSPICLIRQTPHQNALYCKPTGTKSKKTSGE
jgi:hypothetical protein